MLSFVYRCLVRSGLQRASVASRWLQLRADLQIKKVLYFRAVKRLYRELYKRDQKNPSKALPYTTRKPPSSRPHHPILSHVPTTLRPPTPRIRRLPPPPLPPLPRAQTAPTPLSPPLPPAQPHNQTRRIIALDPHLGRKRHHILSPLFRRARLLDHIHHLLIAQGATDAIADQDQKATLGGRQLGAADLGLGAHAEALAGHVAEGARVGQAGHALFAKGVGDEGGGVAAQTGGLERGAGVVVCGEGEGGAGGGVAEQDAGVADVGGEEGAGGGGVPEGGWGWGGDESEGAGGAAFEAGGAADAGGDRGGVRGRAEEVERVERGVVADGVGVRGGFARLGGDEVEVGVQEGVGEDGGDGGGRGEGWGAEAEEVAADGFAPGLKEGGLQVGGALGVGPLGEGRGARWW